MTIELKRSISPRINQKIIKVNVSPKANLKKTTSPKVKPALKQKVSPRQPVKLKRNPSRTGVTLRKQKSQASDDDFFTGNEYDAAFKLNKNEPKTGL